MGKPDRKFLDRLTLAKVLVSDAQQAVELACREAQAEILELENYTNAKTNWLNIRRVAIIRAADVDVKLAGLVSQIQGVIERSE